MRLLLFSLSLMILISCRKENDNKVQDLSGVYMDSLTYTANETGQFVQKDTVIQKKVYKINDSTYKMGGIYNLDTNLVPAITLLLFPIRFVIRPDNTIKVDPNAVEPYSGNIYGSLNLGYYDPIQQTLVNIHRISNPTPQFYEVHKLKRIAQ